MYYYMVTANNQNTQNAQSNQNSIADFLAKTQPSLQVNNDLPTNETLILAIATGLGAWGGFPAPPRAFNRFVSNELVQYALVFVLLMQGGAGKNYKVAGLVTGVMYALHKILDN